MSAGSASRPALGRGTRQPQFLGRGDLPQELATEDCPRPLPPRFSVPKNYSRGTRGGTQSQRRGGGGLGSLALQPQVGAKKGAAFAGRLQGRGSCGMSPAQPRLLATPATGGVREVPEGLPTWTRSL